MTNKQENFLTMMMTTDTILTNNNAVWTAAVPFATAVSDMRARITTIQNNSVIQQESAAGSAANKKNKRIIMATQANTIAAAIKAYAVDTNNTVLHEQVNFSYTDLISGRDTISRDRRHAIAAAM